MKKIISVFFVGIVTLVLSGCGGGSSDTAITSVDILDLNRGYLVTGLNDGNDIVELEFCGNVYDEYINYTLYDFGIFEVNDVYVDFSSGEYIDTFPTDYNFFVGDTYTRYDALDYLIDTFEVTNIELIDCNF